MRKTPIKRKPARSGMTAETKTLLWDRAEGRCERCGEPVAGFDWNDSWIPMAPFSRQHREARGAGGSRLAHTNRVSNLALLCGTATSGCHNVVENDQRTQAYEDGWALRHDSEYTAETKTINHWSFGPVYLTPDGTYSRERPAPDPVAAPLGVPVDEEQQR